MSGVCLGSRPWPPGYRMCSSGRPASLLDSGRRPPITAARRAFSYNFSITYCDAVGELAASGRSRTVPASPERYRARRDGVRTCVRLRSGPSGASVTRHNSRS